LYIKCEERKTIAEKRINNKNCHKSIKIENIFKTLVCRREIKKTSK
jgi:hypothetical protein